MANRKSLVSQQGNDLHYEGFGNLLLSNLCTLKEDETLCDLALTADNETINVHRIIMASCSDYFKALLTLDMKEKGQKVIHLKGLFIYTECMRCYRYANDPNFYFRCTCTRAR